MKTKLFWLLVSLTRRMPNTWIGKRLAFALRRLALSLVDSSLIEIETFGVVMALCPRGNVAERRLLFTPQYFDPVERRHLQSAIKDKFVFFDIGANIGGYTLFVASHTGPDSVLVAIEPQPVIKDRLRANCERNGFDKVTLIDSAVSDHAGTLPFYIHLENAGESGLQDHHRSSAHSVMVPVEPLLDIVERVGVSHIDAMKIDVEGAEEPILTAFLKTAPDRFFPALLIVENGVGRWSSDLLSFILSHGYRLREKTRLNLIFERTISA